MGRRTKGGHARTFVVRSAGVALLAVAGSFTAGSAAAAPPASVDAGVVGDLVWFDANADGVAGPEEPGIGGVTVTLTTAGPDSVLATADDLITSTSTAADGRYEFANVAAGLYRVNVTRSTIPADFVASYESDGSFDDSVTKTSAAAEVDRTIDFGYTRRADLQIVNRVAPGPYAPPTTVVFELTVTNAGPSSADGVTVTDTLPRRMTFVAAGSDFRCTTGDGATVTCALGAMASGAFDTVTVSASVAPVTDLAGFTNTASVSSPTPDSAPANNSATTTIEVVAVQAPPPTDPPTRTLPRTGAASGGLLATSWGLVAVGAALLVVARRRSGASG